MENQSEGNSLDCQAIWRHLLNFLFRKKCVAIAILTLQLQLQLQLNSIERYIAIEIYFTNTRFFLIASLGSQLAQCKGVGPSARDPGSRHRQDYYYFPPTKSMPGSSNGSVENQSKGNSMEC